MLQIPRPGTRFYRATKRLWSWPDVLSGAGAYFSHGGRYHRVHQKTVYASEDPLVSITEYTFHVAIDLHESVGCGPLSESPLNPLIFPSCPTIFFGASPWGARRRWWMWKTPSLGRGSTTDPTSC